MKDFSLVLSGFTSLVVILCNLVVKDTFLGFSNNMVDKGKKSPIIESMKPGVEVLKDKSGKMKVTFFYNSVTRRDLAQNLKYRQKPIKSLLDSSPEADMGWKA